MIDATAVVAAGTVVTVASSGARILRWIAANRTLARLGIAVGSDRPVPAPVARALTRSGIRTDHRLLLHGWAAGVALAAAASLVTSGGPVLAVAAITVPPGAVIATQGRAARHRARQLPLAFDAVAAGLRGGASLRAAVDDAADRVGGPVGDELRTVSTRATAGLPLAEALSEWVDAAEDAGSRLAGAALVVAADLGGPGAAAVDAAAASLRDRTAAYEEVAALSVQARLSALLLTAAPVAFAFLLTSIDPTSARFLLRTPAGWACIAAGLALDAAGAAWMARIVKGSR